MNLFSKITRVRARHCFLFNNLLIFVVEPELISRAVGENGANIKQISMITRRRIKVIASPRPSEIEKFVCELVYPIKFKRLIVENNVVTIMAGPQSKAMLIGRDRNKINQLLEVLKRYFEINALKVL